MFHHGYIFQTMLAEAGPLNDGQVRQHETLQLLYGVNRPFRIRLNDEWHKTRLCLLSEGVPHYINGDGDWQYCFYIYPDSHTGYLLKSSILKDSPVSVFSGEEKLGRLNVMPSAVRPIPAFDLKMLFEQIVYYFTGKRPCLRPDQPLLKKLRHGMYGEGIFSAADLSEFCGMDSGELADQFKRMTEFNLDSWLLHQRMMIFFDRLERAEQRSDAQLDSLCRQSGFAGVDALDRLFCDFFGITYTRWAGAKSRSVIVTDHRSEFPCFM